MAASNPSNIAAKIGCFLIKSDLDTGKKKVDQKWSSKDRFVLQLFLAHVVQIEHFRRGQSPAREEHQAVEVGMCSCHVPFNVHPAVGGGHGDVLFDEAVRIGLILELQSEGSCIWGPDIQSDEVVGREVQLGIEIHEESGPAFVSMGDLQPFELVLIPLMSGFAMYAVFVPPKVVNSGSTISKSKGKE